jgi:hypothetical protein
MMLLANSLYRFEFVLPFRECDQERREAFNLKSPTDDVEGLVEYEGVESFLPVRALETQDLQSLLERRSVLSSSLHRWRQGAASRQSGHFRIPFSLLASSVYTLSWLRWCCIIAFLLASPNR